MSRTPDPTAHIPGYDADEDPRDTGEETPPLTTHGNSAEANRGQRAPRSGSGVVTGSGAGDGGGGTEEDPDGDMASGAQTGG